MKAKSIVFISILGISLTGGLLYVWYLTIGQVDLYSKIKSNKSSENEFNHVEQEYMNAYDNWNNLKNKYVANENKKAIQSSIYKIRAKMDNGIRNKIGLCYVCNANVVFVQAVLDARNGANPNICEVLQVLGQGVVDGNPGSELLLNDFKLNINEVIKITNNLNKLDQAGHSNLANNYSAIILTENHRNKDAVKIEFLVGCGYWDPTGPIDWRCNSGVSKLDKKFNEVI